MKRMQWLWVTLFVLVSLLYWISLSDAERTMAPWALRKSLLYYAGIIAMAMMSVGMVLSLRLSWVEDLTGGLDRSYRLHKWLGVTGVIFALLHWLIKVEPKSLVRQGWVSAQTFETPPGVEDFFNDSSTLLVMKSAAKMAGEWSIYLLAALTLIALTRRIPYRSFFKTHQVMSVVFLALVFHSVVLFGKLGWNSPIGWFMALLMAAGSVAAIMSLTRVRGARRRFTGEVVNHIELGAEGVTRIDIRMEQGWPGHQPGQFAFLTLDRREGAHPFSIASDSSQGDTVVRFYIKHLGDYTRSLPGTVKLGQKAIVEGPYGRFTFEPSDARQIWIAGGVGITPFLSELEHRVTQAQAELGDRPPIDLYICVKDQSAALTQRAIELAARTGVQSHVMASAEGQTLSAAHIQTHHPDWKQSHIWFCGPAGLGQALRDKLVRDGLPAGHFHQELFEMR